MLVDLRPAEVSGKDAEQVLDRVGITVNKNTIPFDPQPPAICSGIRLGTPALTTRGMGVADMQKIASLITRALQSRADDKKLQTIREEVRQLSSGFPLYKHRLVK
jgi:glycine hydroxymethyltransferase